MRKNCRIIKLASRNLCKQLAKMAGISIYFYIHFHKNLYPLFSLVVMLFCVFFYVQLARERRQLYQFRIFIGWHVWCHWKLRRYWKKNQITNWLKSCLQDAFCRGVQYLWVLWQFMTNNSCLVFYFLSIWGSDSADWIKLLKSRLYKLLHPHLQNLRSSKLP